MKVFWVTKRLVFGSAITTWGHVEQLEALGITYVVNLRHSKHREEVRQFKSLWLPFPDDKEPRPKWFYRHALRFCVKAMRKPDTKQFVMCHHGVCRSASLTYFFLRLSQEGSKQAKALVLQGETGCHHCSCVSGFLRSISVASQKVRKRLDSGMPFCCQTNEGTLSSSHPYYLETVPEHEITAERTKGFGGRS
jgi:hypothetical protein